MKTKIDESRIIPYDRKSMAYAAGWKYHFTVFCDIGDGHYKGDTIKTIDKVTAVRKLRWFTEQEQRAGDLAQDAASDGFVNRKHNNVEV